MVEWKRMNLIDRDISLWYVTKSIIYIYISKKYTFYQKDLLALVRTNLYLSYGWVKENEFDW